MVIRRSTKRKLFAVGLVFTIMFVVFATGASALNWGRAWYSWFCCG